MKPNPLVDSPGIKAKIGIEDFDPRTISPAPHEDQGDQPKVLESFKFSRKDRARRSDDRMPKV